MFPTVQKLLFPQVISIANSTPATGVPKDTARPQDAPAATKIRLFLSFCHFVDQGR